MEQIKDELGSDAVLLHTKKYREGGMLGGAEMIEVTAAVDETQSRVPRSAASYTPPPAPILPTNAAERYRMNEEAFAGGTVGVAPAAVPQGYDTYAPAYQSQESMYAADGYGTAAAMNLQSPPAAAPVQQTAPLQPQPVEQPAPPSYTQHVPPPATQPEPLAEPHAEHEEDDASAARIRLLEDELAQMKTMLAAMMAASQPKEIVSIRDALKRQDVRKELREELAAKVPVADINLDSLSPRAKEVLAGYLSQVMKFTDGLRLGAHGSRVVAFIGTTGVGKTSGSFRSRAEPQGGAHHGGYLPHLRRGAAQKICGDSRTPRRGCLFRCRSQKGDCPPPQQRFYSRRYGGAEPVQRLPNGRAQAAARRTSPYGKTSCRERHDEGAGCSRDHGAVFRL